MNKQWKRIWTVFLAVILVIPVLTACSAGDGTTVATVGSETLTYGQANFFVRYNQSMYESYYGSSDGSFWTGDSGMGDGKTMEENVKDSLQKNLENQLLLAQNMEEYGVVITDEDRAAMEAAADEFIAANDPEALEVVYGTKENIVRFMELNAIQRRMRTAMTADVDTEVSDEEALQKRVTYVSFGYTTNVENADEADAEAIDAIINSMSAAGRDAMFESATAFAAEAAEAKTADQFALLAEKYSYATSSMAFGEQTTFPNEEAAAEIFALSEGASSGVIEDEEGESFYVFHMDSDFDEEATENRKSDIVSTRRTDLYNERLDAMREAVSISWKSAWKKISLEKVGVSMTIPDDVTEQAQDMAEPTQLNTDAALEVADGDTVNIDYVGSIDGVEFDGGNTQGMGADLTIGSGTYIDDFEEQLIGAHPGDTVTVEVTFPEDYGNEELNGKDAVFEVVVNGIYQ